MKKAKGVFQGYYYLLLIIFGVFLIGDTILLLLFTSSRSLGIYMPSIIGFPLFVLGVFHKEINKFFKKTVAGKVIKLLLLTGYTAFIILFGSYSLFAYCVGHKDVEKSADVLVVLGCGIKGEQVTLTLKNRLDRATEYIKNNPDTIVIVSGGKGKYESVSEAYAMKLYLVNNGINENKIILEDSSYSTEENFLNSKEIINDMFPNGAKVVFVTTYFHVLRAELVAKKLDLYANGIGANGLWYITFNDYLREFAAFSIYLIHGKI